MIQIIVGEYGSSGAAALVLDAQKRIVVVKSLKYDNWIKTPGLVKYVIGYMPVVGEDNDPKNYSIEPRVDHRLVIAMQREVYLDKRRVISIDPNFKADANLKKLLESLSSV